MNNRNKNKPKIMIVGLDGATFKILNEYLKANYHLRFFSKLIKNGVISNLKVFYPCLSPMEWACFSTGKSPTNLGVFGLYDIKNLDFDYKFFNSNRLGTFFWEILGSYGIKVGIVNIPATYPPKAVRGFIITGLLTPPGKTFYYPQELKSFLKYYKIDFEIDGNFGVITKELNNTQKNNFLKELIELVEIRKKTLLNILDHYRDIDFICINFKEIDSVQHIFWNEKDKIFKIYMSVEAATREIYEYFSPDIIFLISDHGFHQASKKYIHLNMWLEKKGYLKRKKNIFDILKWIVFNGSKKTILKYKFVRNIIPESIKRYSLKEFTLKSIDMENSIAFCDYWGVYINKKYKNDRVTEKLKKDLNNIFDPETSKKVFSNVLTKHELYGYKGKYLNKFPDIVPIPTEGYKILPHFAYKIIEEKFLNFHLTGEHYLDLNGIFICYGDGIRKNTKLSEDIYINDIAPTVLHIYNIPIPHEMDGKVITSIFDENSIYAKKPIKKGSNEKLIIKRKIRLLKRRG